jgi:hypothetical protein
MQQDNSYNNKEKKQINITGQNNRYLMKKLTTNKTTMLRKNLPIKQDMSYETQQKVINDLICNKDKNNDNEVYISEIKHKISGYKQQDIMKQILDTDNFVSFNYVIEKLVESNLKCCYCSQSIYILYEIVRELNQWSLDRINNDIGHNKENVVISCLGCNLKRRNREKDAFMFTKNLRIQRESYNDNNDNTLK